MNVLWRLALARARSPIRSKSRTESSTLAKTSHSRNAKRFVRDVNQGCHSSSILLTAVSWFLNLIIVFHLLSKESVWSFQRLDYMHAGRTNSFFGITKGDSWCLCDKQTVQVKCFVLLLISSSPGIILVTSVLRSSDEWELNDSGLQC